MPARPARRSGGRPGGSAGQRADDVRADRGDRVDLVRADRPAVDRRRRRQRHEGRLHRRRLVEGPQGLLAEQHRLRDLRDPLPGHRRAGQRRHQQRPRVRLPADRGRRHGVHLPAQDRWPAGPQPAPVGRDDRQDLHQRDHQLERPGDHQGQQRPSLPVAADHAGGPLRRFRHHGAVHALDGQPVPGRLAAVLRRHRADVVLPARGPRDRPGRLGPGDEHDRRLRGQRDHRVRRVLLPAQQGLPGRQGPQQVGLLRRADAVQHRGCAHQGEDQPGPEQPAVPHPDPRQGLREPGPAGLPDLVVQLHDHPDRADRRPDDHGQAADARRLPLLLAVRRTDEGGAVRLLATAAQPGAGRLRADRQAQGGRPAGRPDRPRRPLVQQPHLRRPQPLEEQARRDRAAAGRVRQGRRGTVRHRHRHQRAVDRRRQRADRCRHGARG